MKGKIISLILPHGMRERIERGLLSEHRMESYAALLCGFNRQKDGGVGVQLLARDLVLMRESDYEWRYLAGLRVKRTTLMALLIEAERTGRGLIDLHTHPFSRRPSFSLNDDRKEKEMAQCLARSSPVLLYGSVVFGSGFDGWEGRIWERRGAGQPLPRAIEAITCLETPLRRMESFTMPLRDAHSRRALARACGNGKAGIFHPDGCGESGHFQERAIQAYGEEAVGRVASLHVAVVGVGGVGSIVCERLARMGVRRLTIVDHDRVEVSNLNRYALVGWLDARRGLPKVFAAKRAMAVINPAVRVEAVFGSIREAEVLERLKESDLVVVATDDHSSRAALQRFCLQYLKPLIHTGIRLEAERGKVREAVAQVVLALPGRSCLLCSGVVNLTRASMELAHPAERAELARRGYLRDDPSVPTPAVAHLNGIVANLAVAELHNLVVGFKPQADMLIYDQLRDRLDRIEVPEDVTCPWCGWDSPFFAMGDAMEIEGCREIDAVDFPDVPDYSDPEESGKAAEAESMSVGKGNMDNE